MSEQNKNKNIEKEEIEHLNKEQNNQKIIMKKTLFLMIMKKMLIEIQEEIKKKKIKNFMII